MKVLLINGSPNENACTFTALSEIVKALEKEEIMPTEQDEYLFGLCRPERLMDIVFNFI